MPKRPRPGTPTKTRGVDALLREAKSFAKEQYDYILTGEPEPALPGLSAEGKAREVEEAAGGKGNRGKGRMLAAKSASWRGLEKMEESEIFPHIFDALERRKWDAEFALIAGQKHPLAIGLLATDLLQTIGQLAAAAAAGDQQALRSLWLVAREATIQLNHASRHQPVAASALAQTLPKWPAFVGPHRDNLSERKRLIEELQIGAKSPVALKTKWSDEPSPGQPYRHLLGPYVSRAVAVLESARRLRYVKVLQTVDAKKAAVLPGWMANAEALPELCSPGGVEKWCEVALQALVQAGRGKLSGLPKIAPVGEHRARMRQRMEESEKQQKGQAEEAIRERFKVTFFTRYRVNP